MEGPAQLLTLAPVMWDGLEHSVGMVSEWLINLWYKHWQEVIVCR